MKRTELQRHAPLKHCASPPRRRAISPASDQQRAKVRNVCCRACGVHGVQPAHVVDRSIGGCDAALCVIPLCGRCHLAYDLHKLDILPLLDWQEQSHAVSHIGLIGALERTTNESWRPL